MAVGNEPVHAESLGQGQGLLGVCGGGREV